MATVTKLGPADHGRRMSFEEYLAGDYQEGYQYELIRGRLYVSPQPNAPQGFLDKWLYDHLTVYSRLHPEGTNFVHNKARVFVPDEADTVPEPDVAAYQDFPRELRIKDLDWRDVWPVLVVEVVSEGDPDKDFVRNLDLYLRVPSIKEYWILDSRADPDRPTLFVYRRHGKQWRKPLELAFGEVYTTKLLPGFSLTIDPRT
jgi:Uma2 family endonuclease